MFYKTDLEEYKWWESNKALRIPMTKKDGQNELYSITLESCIHKTEPITQVKVYFELDYKKMSQYVLTKEEQSIELGIRMSQLAQVNDCEIHLITKEGVPFLTIPIGLDLLLSIVFVLPERDSQLDNLESEDLFLKKDTDYIEDKEVYGNNTILTFTKKNNIL